MVQVRTVPPPSGSGTFIRLTYCSALNVIPSSPQGAAPAGMNVDSSPFGLICRLPAPVEPTANGVNRVKEGR